MISLLSEPQRHHDNQNLLLLHFENDPVPLANGAHTSEPSQLFAQRCALQLGRLSQSVDPVPDLSLNSPVRNLRKHPESRGLDNNLEGQGPSRRLAFSQGIPFPSFISRTP